MSALMCGLVACGGPAPPVAPHAPDTLESHARAHDAEGLRRAVAALKSTSVDERVRGIEALFEYDPSGLQPLLSVLAERARHGETPAERAAAAWGLVRAGDVRVASAALAAWEAGDLQKVARLDGSVAFEAVAFARLLATAQIDPAESAARKRAMTDALAHADAETRALLASALADDADGASLVAVAAALDPHKDFLAIESLLRRVRELADPRAADALARFADHARAPYFRTEAAVLLAGLGDLRAAPHLAWRMGEDPAKLYDAADPRMGQLARSDGERVVCARMLADLALMHPEARDRLREIAEGPVTAWMQQPAGPHANAMRFLAVSGSPRAAAVLGPLADPHDAIPALGAQPPFPEAFAVAQSALRYLGATHDASAWPILTKQLARKPASFDASMDALTQGGAALAGMTYRALGYGAADGFAELGDAKATAPLVKLAGDPKQNEQVRMEACRAVAWVADARARRDIAAGLRRDATNRKSEFVRACWLTALAENPQAADAGSIVALLAPKVQSESRHQAARLLGLDGLDAPSRAKVVALLADKHVVHDAALALLFGGDEASIEKVFAAYAGDAGAMAPLRQLYVQSMPTVGDGVYESGALARLVVLARAARAAHQDWVLQALSYQLKQSSGDFDAGPHSYTRARLRFRLLADARGPDASKRDAALLVLWALGERASLESLGPIAKTILAEPSPG